MSRTVEVSFVIVCSLLSFDSLFDDSVMMEGLKGFQLMLFINPM